VQFYLVIADSTGQMPVLTNKVPVFVNLAFRYAQIVEWVATPKS
jgi:hypothetical protein